MMINRHIVMNSGELEFSVYLETVIICSCGTWKYFVIDYAVMSMCC